MGTLENLSALVEEIRGTRERLEALADRASALQGRVRQDAQTILSLDKLAHERHPPLPEPRGAGGRWEGDDAGLSTDAWEISLINEEG
jgi:hypothetical protein